MPLAHFVLALAVLGILVEIFKPSGETRLKLSQSEEDSHRLRLVSFGKMQFHASFGGSGVSSVKFDEGEGRDRVAIDFKRNSCQIEPDRRIKLPWKVIVVG